MSSTNAISVIIPVHNQAYPLSITLWGFSRQAPQFRDCEIIIVDDGSTEPIEAVVDSYRDRLNITYVRIPHRGRAAARNEGLCQLDSEVSIAVFCDADRVPRPTSLGLTTGLTRTGRIRLSSDRCESCICRSQSASGTFCFSSSHMSSETESRNIANSYMASLTLRDALAQLSHG